MEDLFICKYCGKICKNKNSLALHEIRCKSNPNKIALPESNFIKYNEQVKTGDILKIYKNQYIKAKELEQQYILSDEVRYKLGNIWRGKQHTEDTKQKISNSIRKAIKEHPESYNSTNVNGRVKHYDYNGIILDGKWELLVAEYLDENSIKWHRPTTGIPYLWNDKEHLYFPDFYLVDYNIYIEVKGYLRDRDIEKWKAINNIVIIKLKLIKEIQNNQYNIFDYIDQ